MKGPPKPDSPPTNVLSNCVQWGTARDPEGPQREAVNQIFDEVSQESERLNDFSKSYR